MIEGHHYQTAYITRNIAKAIASFRDRAGIDGAQVYEATTDVWTPQGSGLLTSKLAFIWVGDMQYELIEPVSGPSDLYTAPLPAGDELKFHHIAMRVDDWDSFRAKVDKQRYPVVIEGVTADQQLKFLYLDARDFLGHYLEYAWATPERWKQIGAPWGA
jgi:hypothetical protein